MSQLNRLLKQAQVAFALINSQPTMLTLGQQCLDCHGMMQ